MAIGSADSGVLLVWLSSADQTSVSNPGERYWDTTIGSTKQVTHIKAEVDEHR